MSQKEDFLAFIPGLWRADLFVQGNCSKAARCRKGNRKALFSNDVVTGAG
jgi:hypothetical protein